MNDDLVVSTVRTVTTDVHGRTLNSAGVHHFIIDGPGEPNEEIVSMEAFLAGISSCATHLLQDFAREEGITLNRAEVTITAERRRDNLADFSAVNLRIVTHGPTAAEANHLVERFKGR